MNKRPLSVCHFVGLAILATLLLGCQKTETIPTNPWSAQATPQEKPSGYFSWFKKKSDKSWTEDQKNGIQLAMAQSYERQGQTEQAMKLYRNIIEDDKRCVEACHRLAVLHNKKGDCQSSEKFYRQALKIQPDNAAILCDLGYSYYLQRRWKEGEECLRRAVELDPALSRAHTNLGLLLACTDRSSEAMVEFTQARCSESEARSNMAFSLMMQERWDDARRQLELALAADPGSEVAQEGLRTLQSLAPRLASSQVSVIGEDRREPTYRAALAVPEPGRNRLRR